MTDSESSARPGAAFKLACAFWAIVVIATVAEVGARAFLHATTNDAAFRRYASLAQQQARAANNDRALGQYVPHRYVGHVPRPGHHGHNDLGFRGEAIPTPKPAGEYRIVCLGGADTYGGDAPYPEALERALHEAGKDHVRVINGGAADYLSHESLMNLQFRVLDLDPDMVIIYHGATDLLSRMIWPPESYTSDNSGMKRPVSTGLFMPSMLEYSTALRMVGIATGMAQPHNADDTSLHRLGPDYYGEEWLDQVSRDRYPSGIFATTPVTEMLEANPPTHFERNLTNIVLTAQANNVVPVVMSFRFSESMELPEGANLPEAFDEMNHVVTHVAEGTGAAFYDYANDSKAKDLATGIAEFLDTRDLKP